MYTLVMAKSILVVDDEPNFLLLLDRLLTKNGFYVRTTSDASQALNLVDQENFDVAILDIQMFPINGITLLAELSKRSPSTKVIMITAYPTADIRDNCVKNGAALLLTKPVDIDHLKTVTHSLSAR
jgi:two-component system NtrC family response regulator